MACQIFSGAFDTDCRKAVFNHHFVKNQSEVINLESTDTMEECVSKGVGERDKGIPIQAVHWFSGGECLGHYHTSLQSLVASSSSDPTSFVCIIDQKMADEISVS